MKTKRFGLRLVGVGIVGLLVLASYAFYAVRNAERAQAAPIPLASFVNVQSAPFVGESFTFTVRFDNSGDAVGYGPYIDVVVPEHVSISSMTYLGNPLTYQSVGTFPAGDPSCLTHPFSRDSSGALSEVCLTPNPGTDVRLYSVKLPFGSFVETQTVADVVVTAAMDSAAPIGVAKILRAQGGFYLGEDALDNPTSDPGFANGFVTTNVTPSVIRLTKQYLADYLNGSGESEITPGPNNDQRFRIQADIANGATISNLVLADTLDAKVTNITIDATTPAATSTSLVGNAVSATWASLTGGAGSSDAVLDIRFEVGYRNAGVKIIDEFAPALSFIPNTATGNGTYNLSALPASNASLSNDVDIKPIAIEKAAAMYTDTNASGYTPGDTVQYTVDTYVGDFQAAQAMVITDILPDGLTYVGGSSNVDVTANGASYTSSVTPSTSAGPSAGETTIVWDLTTEGILRGGCVPAGGSGSGIDPDCSTNNGRTRVRITFRATVNDAYDNGSRVEHGDSLSNAVSVTAAALSPENLAATTANYSDTSSAGITIVNGTFAKSIYAVNGSTTLPSRLQPGDIVTYRLQYDVPSTDFTSIVIDDFLPLPMFTATQLTTFNAADPLGTIPAAGEANFGDNETLYSYLATAPTLSNQAGNVARFTWAATHDASNTARVIDILFTVTINDAAYAPGLYITNQATVTENNLQTSFASNAIQQIELEIPELTITKGAVTSDNTADVYSPTTVGPLAFSAPGTAGTRFSGTISSASLGSTPIQSDVADLDAGDIVTFAVAIENAGKGDAYETRLRDTLPSGLVVPGGGLNLNVSDGTGAAVAYTNVGGGTGLFDQGIEFTPAINDGLAASGTNIVIVTYDLEVASTVIAESSITNNAQITRFTAQPAGVNYMNSQPSYQDAAQVTVTNAALSKSVTATANADTTGNNVAVGEEITYTLTMNIPEGTLPGATLVDTLDACLAVTGFDSLTASGGVTATNGAFNTILGAVVVANVGGGTANDGRRFTLDFGDIQNSNNSNGATETIELVYRAVPINASTCARGNGRNNSATLQWDSTRSVTVGATDVTIQEPAITTTKTFTASGGDAGDTKTIQLVITATSGTNYSPAYNVVTTDDLTATGFEYLGNIVHSSGVAPTSSGESSGTVTFTYDQLNPGLSSTVRFDVRIRDSVQANSSQSNTAVSRYTSMLGTPAGLATYNALGCERTGNTADCGTTENDYTNSSNASITITNVSNAKSQVQTSEAHTATTGVAIGEIVRYRLQSRIPEGTQSNYVLRDAIPNGMSYVNDGTTTAAFVYSSSFTSSTLTDGALNVIGDETTVASVTPSYVLSGGAISAGANGNGTDVDFNFGTITNTDNDSNFEYIVVEFNALIRNEAANTRGTVLNNNFSTRINGAAISGTTSANSGVTVQEPNVSISKSVTTAPLDAGDPVVYTITLTNTSATNVETGYEWSFTDTLNTHLQFDSISNVTAPGYVVFDSSATAGQNVAVSINYLDPGDSVSFRINATVRDTAPANFIVPNTGNISVTSLPGANGTTVNSTGTATPGASGTATGEEVYTGNSSVNTTLGVPSIDKQSPVAGTEYSIGQTVIYPIVVTVPEGIVQNVTLTDALPAGMRYESHALDLTGFTGAFVNDPPLLTSPALVPGNDGEDVILDFGNISTPGTSSANDSFVVNITARVLDVTANYEGQTLSNTATLTYTNPNTALATNVTDAAVVITIREPRLSITKSVASGDPRIVGDILTYTIAFTSDGSVTAYEWSLEDTLPPHTTLDSAPVCTNASLPVAITSGVSSGVLTITPNPLAGATLPTTQTITCEYSLEIASTAVAGTTYTNTVDVDWRNSAASSGFGRAYVDAVSTAQDGTQDTDTANFTMDVVGIDKTDNGKTTAVIGDTVAYTVTIGAPNATLVDFIVTDTLPAGLIYNADSAITGTTGVTPSITGPNDGTGATTLTWNFGTIAHDGTTVEIDYSTRVSNIASSVDGTVLQNDAEVSFTPELSAPVVANDSDSFTVQEPLLTTAITVDNPTPRFGQTVQYTLDIAHDGASSVDAQDVASVVTLPAGLTYNTGSAVLPTGWSVNVAGQVLTFAKASLGLAEVPSITFEATLTEAPSLSVLDDVLAATAATTWTSLAGAQSGERTGAGGVNDYSANDSANVTIQGTDLDITKDDQVLAINPGDTIVYEITVANNGNATATDVTITESVPADTVFDAAGSTSGWSCSDGAVASTSCTFDISSLAALASTQVNFAVRSAAMTELDRTVETISNTVTVAADPANGSDIDAANNSATEVTDLIIADLAVTKQDSVDPVYLDHNYDYILTITNNGPDTATTIVLEDTLPDGVSYRGYSSATASCSFSDPTFTCTLASLANGASETITLEVTGDTPGNKENEATVTHDQQDPDLDNNSDLETTFVDPADIALTKSVDKTQVVIGDVVTYTIAVVNNGPDAATNVVVTDVLPGVFAHDSTQTTVGTCSGTTTISCALGTMANGQTATITVRVKAIAIGSAINQVSSTIAEYDPVTTNSTNVAAAIVTIGVAPANTGLPKQNMLGALLSLPVAGGLLYTAHRAAKKAARK